MNDDSQITLHKSGGFTLQGPDAMNLYRALTLKQGLSLYAKTKMRLTRHVSPMQMLVMATEYTGKTYKRGQYAQAAEDLDVWCKTMRCAIPTEEQK